jgi:DNA primase
VRRTGKLLLLEGYMDVIGCHQHGVDWAMAPLGTSLTAEHTGIVKRYAKDTVVMFDDDRAGIQASVKAAETFMDAGLSVRLASLENGLDPDEFLNERGREEFERRLDAAADALEFRMNLFFKNRKAPPTSQEKAQAVGLLLQTVARQTDEVLKSEWIKNLASRFGVEEASVIKQLRKTGADFARPEPVRRAASASAGVPALERGFLQLLLRDPGVLSLAAGLKPEDFTSPLARRLFEVIGENPAPPAGLVRELTARFPEDAGAISELAMSDPADRDEAKQGAAAAARMLRRFSLQRHLKELQSLPSMTPEQLKEYGRLMSELKASDREI